MNLSLRSYENKKKKKIHINLCNWREKKKIFENQTKHFWQSLTDLRKAAGRFLGSLSGSEGGEWFFLFLSQLYSVSIYLAEGGMQWLSDVFSYISWNGRTNKKKEKKVEKWSKPVLLTSLSAGKGTIFHTSKHDQMNNVEI